MNIGFFQVFIIQAGDIACLLKNRHDVFKLPFLLLFESRVVLVLLVSFYAQGTKRYYALYGSVRKGDNILGVNILSV